MRTQIWHFVPLNRVKELRLKLDPLRATGADPIWLFKPEIYIFGHKSLADAR